MDNEKNFYHKKSHQEWTQKKTYFRKYKNQNQKVSTLMNHHHIHNKFTTLKIVAVYFKDVKAEKKKLL